VNYETIESAGVPIKSWTVGVPVEDAAKQQLVNIASMPFIHKWVAAMPDVHWGMGATVGSVIPAVGAIIPAAVGVDIGCGMIAHETTLMASDLPDNLHDMRSNIEEAVPHGRTNNGGSGDRGAWSDLPLRVQREWAAMLPSFELLTESHPGVSKCNNAAHLGTLGTGNHFIEVCIDERGHVWVMLHSGSRGVGNRIGSHFIALAKKDMGRNQVQLPDKNLSYLDEGSDTFRDYVSAVGWAQNFAKVNRDIMMESTLLAIMGTRKVRPFTTVNTAVNCHHNYVSLEHHYGKDVFLTRKGAVSAKAGELGIIPGSMGARSFIVRGKGNHESFCSCSHGAGRAMSRTEAKKRFTVADHEAATAGVECRKDDGVIDETPMAYKDIDAVMDAQRDLVDIVHTLKQVVCVKG